MSPANASAVPGLLGSGRRAESGRRAGPRLAGQMLMCPMLDDRNDSPSSRQMAGRRVWDHTANQTGWAALPGDKRGGPDVSRYAAPARAADLSDLPPAFIDVGSAETFRDEDVSYASRIRQAGCPRLTLTPRQAYRRSRGHSWAHGWRGPVQMYTWPSHSWLWMPYGFDSVAATRTWVKNCLR